MHDIFLGMGFLLAYALGVVTGYCWKRLHDISERRRLDKVAREMRSEIFGEGVKHVIAGKCKHCGELSEDINYMQMHEEICGELEREEV